MARVLVVEDDPDILRLVTMILRRHGHDIAGVGAGDEALAYMLRNDTPDVVVLDVGLPGMSGLELLPRLRELAQQHLPAIFLSARVQDADVEAGRALDAVYLTKPIASGALTSAVDRAVLTSAGDRWPLRSNVSAP